MLKFYLPNSHEDEKIIMLLRRHWFIIIRRLTLWLFVAAFPVIFILLAPSIAQTMFASPALHIILVASLSVYYLFVWLFMFHGFVDYYLDTWIVTNERIVNIEQKGLFSRTVSEQKLFRIQDVTSELNGVFPTVLNYGEVYVQTAGEKTRFIFKQVPDPQRVAKKIIEIIEYSKRYQKVIEGDDSINTRES